MMLENRKDNLRIESVNTMSEFEKPPDFIFINPRHYIEEKSNFPQFNPKAITKEKNSSNTKRKEVTILLISISTIKGKKLRKAMK